MASNERCERPVEQPVVKTTIVGGRPPGTGKGLGDIPRGIEVLIKKAVVDREFREVLLEKRAEAAKEIGLELSEAEAELLNAAPAGQLRLVIARTRVSRRQRAAFVGRAAAVMLAAVTTGALKYGCEEWADNEREKERELAPLQVVLGITVGPAEEVRGLRERSRPLGDGARPDEPPSEPKEDGLGDDESRQ